ncbi:alpha/beta hydrolase fold domain-containing protein [Streptomyces sp. Li-HN-5-11]|uniref:alpha/beta hydrolase fold domain-containing protein n=1 Tax=Streptomyces sp. Li-HN-5-11 TaxID=3075432 RepID=UPI0028A926C7|nr:alpha/beta hydrolase fold domain-containing protein [Streptomyces sp. Li-HN-5-11]WNM31891.1 alpha/beta hydrolase fold domain-containing protein [Streptomyces sp. Li-HN-5-11]
MASDVRVGEGPFGPEVRPEGGAPEQTVLYLHGDPRLAGTPQDALPIARALSRHTGHTVVCARYRPRFPQALEDVYAAWEHCHGRGPVAVAGKRLGGALAAGLLLRLRDAGAALPSCAVLTSPVLDFTLDAPSLLLNAAADRTVDAEVLPVRAAAYAGATLRTHPLLSPLHGNLHGLPPLQLHAAGTDVLLDDTLSFATRAAHSGVAVDVRIHEDSSVQGMRQVEAMAEFLRVWCHGELTTARHS